jgi:hypothetical protein
MSDEAAGEREVVLEQLQELLDEGVEDEHDALELASLAGLAVRLGAALDATLQAAEALRDGEAADLLADAFQMLELDDFTEAIDAIAGSPAPLEEIEDAVFDFDEVVAGAIWAGHRLAVRAAARTVAATIRQVPETFAPLSDYATELARSVVVARDMELYDYWFAVADAGRWKDS